MLDDYGALIRSGQEIVPDFAAQEMQRQMLQLRKMQISAAVQEAQREAEDEKTFQTDIAGVFANPTPEAYSRLILKHPKRAEAVKKGWEMLDESRRRTDLTQLGEIYAASSNGRYDVAAKILRKRIEADKAANGEAADTADEEELIADLESGDPQRQKSAMAFVGIMGSAIAGPDKWAKMHPNEQFTLTPGSQRFDAFGNVVASVPFAPRPLTVGEGDTIIEYQPGGGGPASGGAGSSTPRGVRNNNPGNLRDGPFAKSQPGYKGADADGFAVFDTSQAGMAAQTVLLANKYLSKGINTADAIVEKYAPASENSAESRANYKAHIASALGIGINDPIPVERAGELAQAVAGFENGTSGGQGGKPKVIAKGAPKTVKPSETRVLNGKTYYKINGRWYDNAEGV